MEKDKEIKNAMDNYYTNKKPVDQNVKDNNIVELQSTNANMPKYDMNAYDQKLIDQMQDSDLEVGVDVVKLPSKGIFYKNKISELTVEYLTSKDEDILTTPALIENNTLIDVLLRNKIKTKGITVEEMLSGDKNAVLVFLRASSYGHNYDVVVNDPFSNNSFKSMVDLTRLKYKEIAIMPDENLLFTLELPMRKKEVKFRLITDNELKKIIKQAETRKEATGQPFLELLSMRLKASIISINGNQDRNYISKFVDAMPAGDSLALRRKIDEVTPDVDYKYEFTSPGGYTFEASITLGSDFFFPKI
jgi:hypothetical protein